MLSETMRRVRVIIEAVEVIVTLPSTTHGIGEQLSQEHVAQKLKNRQALYQILSSIKFLGNESDGNF